MTTPQPNPQRKPTSKQLRYLRDLAEKTGQSFAYPTTSAQASREIDRLKKVGRTPAADRRREMRQVSRDLAERRGDCAAIDEATETEGWGSTATWATAVED